MGQADHNRQADANLHSLNNDSLDQQNTCTEQGDSWSWVTLALSSTKCSPKQVIDKQDDG